MLYVRTATDVQNLQSNFESIVISLSLEHHGMQTGSSVLYFGTMWRYKRVRAKQPCSVYALQTKRLCQTGSECFNALTM